MILTCPECRTKYIVNPATLGREGRHVRCAKCHHSWRQDPPAIKEEDLSEVAKKSLDQEEKLHQSRKNRETLSAEKVNLPALPDRQLAGSSIKAWSIFLLCIVVIGAVFYGARQPILSAFPALQPLYQLVGLEADMVEEDHLTLKIEELSSKRVTRISEEGLEVYSVEISGFVRNFGEKTLDLPPLYAQILKSQAEGEPELLQEWYFKAKANQIASGEVVTFKSSYDGRFEGATDVDVEFWVDPLPNGITFLE